MSGSSSVIGTVSSNGLERRCNPVCLIRVPESSEIRTARDKADHLPHPGFSSGTREPVVERQNETSGKPPSPAKSRHGGRVLVVVGARESRVHGEGGQSMRSAALSLG
jgi:hypothetical protein